LLAKFLPSCDEDQSYDPWKLFAISCCLYSKINISDFFHIHGLDIFASIVSDSRRSSRAVWFIDFSFRGSGIHKDFTYSICHAVLLPLTFIVVRVLDSIMSYGRSKCVFELDEFGSSELRKVEM
jgi:hypothetical protein